jgi:hypothetical protein
MNKYVTMSTGTATTKNAAITTSKRFKLRVENGTHRRSHGGEECDQVADHDLSRAEPEK